MNRSLRGRNGFADPSTPTGSLRSQDNSSIGLPHAWVTEACGRELSSRQCLSFTENVHVTTPRRVLRAIPKASSGRKGSLLHCQGELQVHGNCSGPAEEVARSSGGTSSRSKARTGPVKCCLRVRGCSACWACTSIHPCMPVRLYLYLYIYIYIYVLYVCVYVCVYIYIYIYIYVCEYINK